jgi:hypothetical protein
VNNDIQVFKDKLAEMETLKEKLEKDLSETTANLNKKTAEVQVNLYQ